MHLSNDVFGSQMPLFGHFSRPFELFLGCVRSILGVLLCSQALKLFSFFLITGNNCLSSLRLRDS